MSVASSSDRFKNILAEANFQPFDPKRFFFAFSIVSGCQLFSPYSDYRLVAY